MNWLEKLTQEKRARVIECQRQREVTLDLWAAGLIPDEVARSIIREINESIERECGEVARVET